MKLCSKFVFISLYFIAVIFTSCLIAEEKIDAQLWEKAIKIHQEAVVIDTHCDTPMLMLDRGLDIGQKSNNDLDLIRMKEGGLDAVFFAAFVGNDLDQKNPAKKALEMIDVIYEQVEKYPNLAKMALSPGDIWDIHREGKRAILIGIENGGPLENNLHLLRNFYRLGVRYITLTHNDNNDICDSSSAKTVKWNGVSPFGQEVIKEMNRLGMLIDVSHISDKAFHDVLEFSKAPVFASHSSTRYICGAGRNMSDDMILALAKKGGVIQITYCSFFVDDDYRQKAEANEKVIEPEMNLLKEKYKDNPEAYWNEAIILWKKNSPPSPPIEKLIDHIDHAVKVAGVDHVGLGSDYDGAGSYPVGLENVSGMPLITYHLLKRGYSERDIKKILGGNFLRVFEAAINVSKNLKIERR
ncbi:MAG: dipeptidase [Acidobacteria bacterium]|jgi:membrane dipeptidase|nr:dipeptidase [Acidobacteriota bacterium]